MLSCNWEEKFNQIDRRKPFKICSTAQRDERDGDFFYFVLSLCPNKET